MRGNEWLLLLIAVVVLVSLCYGLYRLIAAAVRRGQNPREKHAT